MTDPAPTNDTGGTPLDAALAYARPGVPGEEATERMTVSEQVPSFTPVTLRAAVRVWDDGPLHAQHNDPGAASHSPGSGQSREGDGR